MSSVRENPLRNQYTHLDKVGDQYESGIRNPRVEVSESLLHLQDHWFDEALLFL